MASFCSTAFLIDFERKFEGVRWCSCTFPDLVLFFRVYVSKHTFPMLYLVIFAIFNLVKAHNIDDEVNQSHFWRQNVQSIKLHWSDDYVELCEHPEKYFASQYSTKLLSFRMPINYIDFVDFEVRSVRPTLVVLKRFATKKQAAVIEQYLNNK